MLTTIQTLVVNVDTKVNELSDEVQGMKAEILDMKGKIESSKCQESNTVDRQVDYNKAEIVNTIHDQKTKFDKISEVFVKIVASQNTLSDSLKGVARNLPKRDLLMDKRELSQCLGEIKQSIKTNKPTDNTEIVAHLKKLKDVAQQLPNQGQIMTKQELEQQFNDVKGKIRENQGATGGL